MSRRPAKRPTTKKKVRRREPDTRRIRRLRRRLLGWAKEQGRSFFWREPGLTPYESLVTEVLLTKTRAELVASIAPQVLERYPSVIELADARVDDLEAILFPLGLHRKRAAGLVSCAKTIVEEYGGRIPDTIEGLMKLPSVGRYAANAIACVVYDQRVAVLDANVSRIYQRVFSLPPPPDRLASAHELWATAQNILPPMKAKEFNWAILDLGGTICTAKVPACDRCPIFANCDRAGLPSRTDELPRS